MRPSAETDGAGGQLSKHTTHFSVTTSRRLSKHAGTSVIDAFINEVIALLVCICLMYLCSVQISMILNLHLSSQRSSSSGGGWVGGCPSNLIPFILCLLPSSVPSSFDYADHLDAHTQQQTASPMLLDSLGCCGGGAPFFVSHWSSTGLFSIRDQLCHLV